ncbi:MAG: PepSY domain-containing protein [Alphaproteobacteria bacterium]|nr:PepSY domain-containing protein [Alphaproteobacteria bacterium]
MTARNSALLAGALLAGLSGMALAAEPPAAAPATAQPTAQAPAVQPAQQTAQPTLHHAMRAHHARVVARDHKGGPDTQALNLLEANGYGQIVQFGPESGQGGGKFDATVMKDGKQLQVTVDPATGQIQQRA